MWGTITAKISGIFTESDKSIRHFHEKSCACTKANQNNKTSPIEVRTEKVQNLVRQNQLKHKEKTSFVLHSHGIEIMNLYSGHEH